MKTDKAYDGKGRDKDQRQSKMTKRHREGTLTARFSKKAMIKRQPAGQS
ncbi:TPA: hypothetical protein TVE80_000608 [Streptococcus equi subsp. zooepidemicus]|nr:hypothetical protein [Streptococcus equi subsp. zooepidemicus]HEL1093814.1 hypothetical protein [Streptococcus equi subsp. zooepidemicus]HEL1121815.1 hypothetical protein [Streptococcus equi subsp. zooepidemicus]HEL1154579.1 hypothetical protein [Streptococcus equi subsp. zooepidemicus]HEL1200112.1 hypothetical protein [Streptococcus equi subsp. zooepidemicus]